MFDFSKSFSSKSNLVRGLKADNIDVATCTVETKEGRWYASPIVTPVDNFEASESELAAQQARPGHVWEEPVIEPVAPAPVAAPVASPVAAPAKAVKAPKVAQEVRNGITRPKANGICGKAWAIFDNMGPTAQNKDAVYEGDKQGINEYTIRTQIYRWRTFNGIALQGRKKAK